MPEEINEVRIRTGVARNLARKLLAGAKITQAPISLTSVIRYLQETRDLSIYPVASFGERLSGMLVIVEREGTDKDHEEIHFNNNHGWHRQRFTISHEIGHLLMNTSCDGSSASFNGGRSPAESEANLFSAELLMPTIMVKKDLRSGMDIPTLAWRYIVSQEAMGWKVASCI